MPHRDARLQALVLGVAALGMGACGEPEAIVAPLAEARAAVTIAAKPAGPSIVSVDVGAGTFVIDGAAATVDVTVTNPGKSSLSNVFIDVRVVQSGSFREVASVAVSCPGAAGGVLPGGGVPCTVPIEVAVGSSGGSGSLAQGAATLDATLRQASGKKGKILDTFSSDIVLAESGLPAITAVTLESSTFVIDGAGVNSEVTLLNPTGSSIGGAVLQATISQGPGNWRSANGTTLLCSTPGTLPVGQCTIQFLVSAANGNNGVGTLTPGPAVLALELLSGSTVLDTWTENITLEAGAGAASITDLVLDTNELTIEGPTVDYTVTIGNTGGARDGVIVQARLLQGTTVDRAAGGAEVQCPGQASGVLPTGGCSFDYYAFASNFAGGAGTLAPGEATLVLDLYDETELVDSWEETVNLVNRTDVYIAHVALQSTTFNIGGDVVGATITIHNYTGVVIDPANGYGRILQNGHWRDAGDIRFHCNGADRLPQGVCVEGASFVASNARSGDGDLDVGPADLEIVIRNTSNNILDTVLIPITLVRDPL